MKHPLSYALLLGAAAILASCGGGGSSGSSSMTTSPTVPANLAATSASATQINVSWAASTSTGAITYLIERCQGSSCSSFAQIATSASTGFNDTGLTAATSYSYRVRAQNTAGAMSGYSAVASATTLTLPSVPAGLTATAMSTTQINLAWTASTPASVTYLLERCQGSGCASFAQIATAAGTAFNDTGLTAATSYSYRVRAQSSAGQSGYSNVASTATSGGANVSVTITPSRGGLAISQPLTMSASVANDPSGQGVSWSASAGSFMAQTPTSATYIAPATAGVVTITATSVANGAQSASATLGVTDLAAVATYHNDNARDGVNAQEYALTTANVSASFGKLFSCTVDGAIYAQPLWVANRTVNNGQHNVVIVATMHDSVYAFDADTSPCMLLWHANLLDTAHGATANETSVPSGTANSLVGAGYGDIKPEIGVTGTPVIDPVANIIYVVSKSAVNNALPIYQRLHALNLLDGTETGPSPTTIGGASFSVSGTADGSSSVSFNPQQENQRPGLALVNGNVYVGWASHEDQDPYHGWLMGFSASALTLAGIFNSTPNQVTGYNYSRGGIWMSGGAPAADAGGNLYVSTGNGTFDANMFGSNYGDSTVKLNATLGVTDWFTPADQASLDSADNDHGSGGATVLLNTPTGHYMVVGGKEGTVFLVSLDSLGHYGANFSPANSNAQQAFSVGNGLFSTAGFWNNSLYVGAAGSHLQLLNFNTSTALFNTTPASVSNHVFAWPGASPSISASGTTNGIVWATDNSAYCTQDSPGCGPAVLYALDAGNLNELWNSSNAAADQAGLAVKFTLPTVANGKVYIGTRGNDSGAGGSSVAGELDVYGLQPN